MSGLDTLLQAARFLELQEQQQQIPHKFNSDVTIIPTNSQTSNGSSSVHTNSSNSTISLIPSHSTGISETRFLPPIGKISNGTVILTTASSTTTTSPGSASTGGVSASPARLISPLNGGVAGGTTTAVVTGLVPQGTTAYLTTSSSPHSVTLSSIAASSPRHQPAAGGSAIVPLIGGSGSSRKRTISNASSHSSSGGYGKDDPLVNGHSTAPPLVVISTNGSSSSSSTSNSSTITSHQKHHPASSLTIDLSTKSSSSSSTGTSGHHLSSTPPSSGCSSSSSTLTISPVDDSQSSLNLSNGSSGYITSSSANTSSSLNLSGSNSGSSPLPITLNGGVITSSHGSNSPSLPHDLVIVQQQQQLSHLVQTGQLGLTSTNTLLGQIPTGGRRRTTSSNSNGVGTREVHNKLEKNRRAHLKECFEQLKKQLTLQPDEKKTSNLSILHAAIRHIQLLKRREREYEHDMERLAKEKIAAQNRILLLKRELSQWGDVDFSRLAADTEVIPGSSSVQSDRDLLNDPPGIAPGRNGIRYSSSSSLSSVATTASLSNLPLQTTISPVVMSGSSPLRASPPMSSLSATNRSSNSPAAMPLSLTTKGSPNVSVADTHNGISSPLKLSTGTLPNGFNLSTTSSSSSCRTNITNVSTIGNGFSGTTTSTALPLIVGGNNLTALSQSQLFTPVTATILTTGGGTSIQSLPLNLNVTSSVTNGSTHSHHVPVSAVNGVSSSSSGLQIIGTTANGTTIPAGLVSSTTGKELINGTLLPKNGFRTEGNKIEIIATSSNGSSTLDPPATKVIKLVNGNTIVGLTSVDKVVQQGGIVVSPIQLLTSAQGLRVIQQSQNGLATIELSTPANVQSQSNQAQRTIGGNGSFNGTNSSTNSLHLSSHPSNQSSQTTTHQQIQQMTGAQLHKLLLSSTNAHGLNGFTSSSNNTNNGTNIVSSTAFSNGPVSTTTITPELARLPGGAELNILPVGTNSATALPLYRTTGQPGKLAFVNAISASNGGGLTLKGTECTTSNTGRTAVHVVTPIQTSSGQLSGLTPVVVSRYDHSTTLPALFTTASGPQTSTQLGKVVKTVGQSPSGLPLIAATPNAQYLNTVLKPTVTTATTMMVTVGSSNTINSNSTSSYLPSAETGNSEKRTNLVLLNSNNQGQSLLPPASIMMTTTPTAEVTAIAN
ncbi:mucin-5AC isoform X2 [Topomyia yanbarensis]|uniref:mucin-5AC isoform X2 n=1 Tax=Topomyia yanbarensis TaxID=2498891 RepID=UPI00273C3CD0|nr:mucin-5AC isoform X2 [Topomyia yanbarensis]XP_058825105.1 mucin-5AC isoform X2 [Topomyia yanbarensis]XP_058825107.1 mucin-5AC isoform X2 [Topomyia yanbarensis]